MAIKVAGKDWVWDWLCTPDRIPPTIVGRLIWLSRRLYRFLFGLSVALAVAFVFGILEASLWLRVVGGFVLMPCLPIFLLRWVNPKTSMFMEQTRRRLGDRPIAFEWTSYRDVSPNLPLAVLVTEDIWFPWHIGFDPLAIYRAYRSNRSKDTLHGGSCITQQLVKNLFLWPSRTYTRKAVEFVLTLFVEGLLPKRRILELYVNVIQFDEAVFGIGTAAERFFQKTAADLTVEESALLVAAVPNPIVYRVASPSAGMRRMQTLILERMQAVGERVLKFDL